MNSFVIPFDKIGIDQIPEVGGKNASLGEMFNKLLPMGIEVPDGFAVAVEAYRLFLSENDLVDKLRPLLDSIEPGSLENLPDVAEQCRVLVSNAVLPPLLTQEILIAYRILSGNGNYVSVAVRSSATAEDLPTASFAGQHDSFLNIQ